MEVMERVVDVTFQIDGKKNILDLLSFARNKGLESSNLEYSYMEKYIKNIAKEEICIKSQIKEVNKQLGFVITLNKDILKNIPLLKKEKVKLVYLFLYDEPSRSFKRNISFYQKHIDLKVIVINDMSKSNKILTSAKADFIFINCINYLGNIIMPLKGFSVNKDVRYQGILKESNRKIKNEKERMFAEKILKAKRMDIKSFIFESLKYTVTKDPEGSLAGYVDPDSKSVKNLENRINYYISKNKFMKAIKRDIGSI